jgi:hypothetical protein
LLLNLPVGGGWWVQIFVQLPASVSAKAVSVELTSNFLSVTVGGEVLMKGDLFLPIKQDMSTWLISASAARSHPPAALVTHVSSHDAS